MYKLSPKILFLSLTCMMLINGSRVSGVKLKCNFVANGFSSENFDYCNFLNDNNIFTGSRVIIDSVEITNLGSKTIDDIQALNIVSIPSFNYIPGNLAAHFKNIFGIQVASSNLLELKKSDLEQFKKLQYLYLSSNKIIALEGNLFEHNPELKYIYISSNQITHIDPNICDSLSNLNYLHLNEKCKTTFGVASPRSEVLKFIERIRNGECSSETFLQKKKEAQDQLIRTAKLQAENDCKTNLTELQNKLTSIEQSNEDLKKQLNAANLKNQDLEKSNNDLQDKCSTKDKSVDELTVKNQELMRQVTELHGSLRKFEQPINDLTTKNQMCSDKMHELRDKYENILQKKLIETEVLVGKLKEGRNSKNADIDDEQKNGECLTMFFSPQQRPIILSN